MFKKITLFTLLTLSGLTVFKVNALQTSISVPGSEQLTSININPTFKNVYSELVVPSTIISKIQRNLATSPIHITVEVTKSKKYYNVVFTAKNQTGKIIASKTFTNLTDKNRAKIPTTTAYLHTNFNYRLSMNAKDSSLRAITQNPFTITVSMAK